MDKESEIYKGAANYIWITENMKLKWMLTLNAALWPVSKIRGLIGLHDIRKTSIQGLSRNKWMIIIN